MSHTRSVATVTLFSAALLVTGCHGWEVVSPATWPELAARKDPPPIRIFTKAQTIEIEQPTIVRAPTEAPSGQPEWKWHPSYPAGVAPSPLILVSGAPETRAYLGGGVHRAEPGILVELVPGRDQVKILTLRPGPTIGGVFATIGLLGLMALISASLVYLMTSCCQG